MEEPFDFVRAAQARWKAKVFKRVNVLAKESGIALSRRRDPALAQLAREELLEKVTYKPLSLGMFLYDVTDLHHEVRRPKRIPTLPSDSLHPRRNKPMRPLRHARPFH